MVINMKEENIILNNKSRNEFTPHPFDKKIGSLIRNKRILKGLSQTKLGDLIGVTFQQIQKYEKGTNRVAMSRYFKIAKILNFTPVELIDMDNEEAEENVDELSKEIENNIIDNKYKLLFCKRINKISNTKTRKIVFETVFKMIDLFLENQVEIKEETNAQLSLNC